MHLIEPLGFELEDKKLRRAGLDYHEWAEVKIHASLDELQMTHCYALSTHGRRCYSNVDYQAGDTLIFGPETRGLPQTYLDSLSPENVLRLPMLEHSRSLNLSNTVAVVVYEALRQTGFAGLLK